MGGGGGEEEEEGEGLGLNLGGPQERVLSVGLLFVLGAWRAHSSGGGLVRV